MNKPRPSTLSAMSPVLLGQEPRPGADGEKIESEVEIVTVTETECKPT